MKDALTSTTENLGDRGADREVCHLAKVTEAKGRKPRESRQDVHPLAVEPRENRLVVFTWRGTDARIKAVHSRTPIEL